MDGDPHAVGGRQDRAWAGAHLAGGEGQDVLAERHVDAGQDLGEVSVDHGLGAGPGLLGRLEQGHQPAVPGVGAPSEELGGAQQTGHWTSWPQACITGTSAVRVGAAVTAGIRQAGLLPHRESVHVRPQQHSRTLTIGQHPDHPGATDTLVDREPGLLQPLGDRLPEYRLAHRRYAGQEQGDANVAAVDHPGVRMARIGLRPA